MQAMKEISQCNNRICSLGKWPPNSNADQMKTSRQQGIHYNDEWCYSSKKKNARFDILIFALLAKLDILVFALNNSEIRHTHLRSTKFITIQGTPTSRKINAIKMRWYIDLYFAQSQCDDRFEFRSNSIRRSIWISLHQNATIHRFKFRFIKMRRYIDLDFASSKYDDTSIWISLHQNVTIELLR